MQTKFHFRPCLCVQVAADAEADATAAVQRALKKCQETSKLSVDQLNQACMSTLPSDETQKRAYKCFAKCVQQRVGIMSEEGKIDPERSRALVHPSQQEQMKAIAEKCLGDGETDLCEKAYKVDQCYNKENEKMYQENCKNLIRTITKEA
ncbi:uncharacterized protein LOC117640138 isoform X2 [Thrips palmi]|uniref:Uncharacterized protein LOC117640138 isoform X2 n=1 Tax=Thrips palmi TaxID=161013 RepID=A0A6P8XYW8_THRPL|nr:uncharacterized protein LOC117640138 isoform X2 [Thrips palmi]